ncbi:hypothetical protein AC1031_011440 [Aphanomyces cochlioides]|nr:hypothetical protein AC1031_011440 [Aphanomyces cochlioides]
MVNTVCRRESSCFHRQCSRNARCKQQCLLVVAGCHKKQPFSFPVWFRKVNTGICHQRALIMRLVTPLTLAASTVVAFHQPHRDSPVTPAHPQQVHIDSTVHRALEDKGIQEWGRRHASPSRQFLNMNRKLEGKYEKKYRERCELAGAVCGGAAGAVVGAGIGSVTFGVIPGMGHIGGAVAGGIPGVMVGATAGKAVGGKWGAKRGKAKDERLARQSAANGQQRPAANSRQSSARFIPQQSGRRGPR